MRWARGQSAWARGRRARVSAPEAGSDDVGLDLVVDGVRRIAGGDGAFEEPALRVVAAVAAGSQDDRAIQLLGAIAGRALSVPLRLKRAGLRVAGLQPHRVSRRALQH